MNTNHLLMDLLTNPKRGSNTSCKPIVLIRFRIIRVAGDQSPEQRRRPSRFYHSRHHNRSKSRSSSSSLSSSSSSSHSHSPKRHKTKHHHHNHKHSRSASRGRSKSPKCVLTQVMFNCYKAKINLVS